MIHTVTPLVRDGVTLHSEAWLPSDSLQALLVVIHGITEHIGRYASLCDFFVPEGIGVCGFDLRGHGRSSGRRGHLQRGHQMVEDLDRYLQDLALRHPGVPVFLFGHSLGSLIVLSRVMEHPEGVQGVIACGTAVEPVGVASPFQVFLARTFSRLWPVFFIPIPRRTTPTLSRIPSVEEAFWNDPLVLKGISARFGSEGLDLIESVRAGALSVTLPLLMIHGGSDPLNTPEGARRFFERASSADKQWITYPGGLHEPLNDLDRAQVLEDLLTWIRRHLPSGPAARA